MSYVYSFLNIIMEWCYDLCRNYALAIVLFTFCTKILLLPVSLWTYFNSIKMIKIQPDINYLKVKYYGQKDKIAEEQAAMFKKKGYHPLASTVPTILQLFLLAGVVGVIKLGMQNPSINMTIGTINLGWVPAEVGLSLVWSPIMAGLSSWILCVAQNASNVLQAEQSKWNKYGTMIFSVGLSLYLGWFVAIGTAYYWVWSNLFAVLQLYITNWIVRPRRFVDYDRLEDSRKKLGEIQGAGNKKEGYFSENRRRERADFKKFFKVVNKHLVFYSESNGFYKYFRGYIEYILEHTNITIHYITSDPSDKIFDMARENQQIRAYYVGGNKLITLMMMMDADIVCMTMPDLDNYYIKRSYVRDDIEYIYIEHGMDSVNLTTRKGSRDNFDTIFCSGPHRKEEIEKTEIVYNLKKKNLLEIGYPLLDDLKRSYDAVAHEPNVRKKILIAPSWQPDNIVDSCLNELLEEIKDEEYDIIVRPHPQHVRHKGEYIDALKAKYEGTNIEVQNDFTSDNPVMQADILITDWSAISMEFAFTTLRPVLFINTPMKVMNPDWQDIDTIPINIEMRDKLGKNIDTDKLSEVPDTIKYLLDNTDAYRDEIRNWMMQRTYNLGNSAEIGAKYIINDIKAKIDEKKRKEQQSNG